MKINILDYVISESTDEFTGSAALTNDCEKCKMLILILSIIVFINVCYLFVKYIYKPFLKHIK